MRRRGHMMGWAVGGLLLLGLLAWMLLTLPAVDRDPALTIAVLPAAPVPSVRAVLPATGPPTRLALRPPPAKQPIAPAPAAVRARIAIVIDDLGLNEVRTRRALALPGPLSLSFLPYGRNLPELVAAAAARGHEIWLHLPMEPQGGQDAGPGALKSSMDAPVLRRQLVSALASFTSYVGINNHMGSRLTADRMAMRAIMPVLAERGLLFLDSRTSPHSVALQEALAAGVPGAGRDVFLDHESDVPHIRQQLARLVQIAHERGQAIAIGHPNLETLQTIAEWLPTITNQNLELVPASSIILSNN